MNTQILINFDLKLWKLTDFEIELEIFDFAKVLGRSNFEF